MAGASADGEQDAACEADGEADELDSAQDGFVAVYVGEQFATARHQAE